MNCIIIGSIITIFITSKNSFLNYSMYSLLQVKFLLMLIVRVTPLHNKSVLYIALLYYKAVFIFYLCYNLCRNLVLGIDLSSFNMAFSQGKSVFWNIMSRARTLRPKTIDDSNCYTIAAKCNQTENWNEKSNDKKIFLLCPCVNNLKGIKWYRKYSLILSDYARKLIAWRHLAIITSKLLASII